MRLNINGSCNVLTDEHCKGYHRPGTRPVEITIPEFRANLKFPEVERLIADLTEALAVAKVKLTE